MDLAKEFPTDFIEGWHLFNKKDAILTIADVRPGQVLNYGTGKMEKGYLITFKETPKKLKIIKTTLKTLVVLFGATETNDWVGQRIALFAEWIPVAGQQKLGVRIRDYIPDPPKPTRRQQKENGGPNEAPPMSETEAIQGMLTEAPETHNYNE